MNESVRARHAFGGRLVKFKCTVASIAPMMGVAILLSGISAGAAMAADECGLEVSGQDAITCDAVNLNVVGTYPDFPDGITYTDSDAFTLTLDDPAIAIVDTGISVTSTAGTGGDISVIGSDFDTITTAGPNTGGPAGISVNLTTGYTGGASIILGEQAGMITTTGRSAGAIIASYTSGPGDLLIEMHGGEITTDGFQANALQIFQSPVNGPLPIAANPPGAAESTGNLTIQMTGGTILAQGDSSDGITVNSRGLGNALVEMTGGSIEANVTESLNAGNSSFSGVFANGISVYNSNLASEGDTVVRMTGGRIDVDGPVSNGVIMENQGTGLSSITVGGDAVIEVVGANSNGVQVATLQPGDGFQIVIDGSASVRGGSGLAAAILINNNIPMSYDGAQISAVSGTVLIGAGATIDGTASGLAIADVQNSGLYDGNSTTMFIRGTLLGDILAGAADDIVRIEDDADIADVAVINGGDDNDELTFSNWSGSDAAARGDVMIADINGEQIADIEEVFLTNNADVTFGGASLANGSENGLLFEIERGSVARFVDTFEIDGDVNNFGALDLSGANRIAGTVLNVTGNYAAASDLLIDFDLSTGGGTDNNPANDALFTDQLLIGGNASGTTNVFFNNVGGAGITTDLNDDGIVDSNEGLLFAQVSGTAAADSFVLGAPAGLGAFALDIFSFGPQNQVGGWDYVLALTDDYSVAAPIYEALPLALLGLQTMPSLQQRVGNRHWAGDPTAVMETQFVFCKDPAQNFSCAVTPDQSQVFAGAPTGATIEGAGVWARVEGSRSEIAPVDSTTGITMDQNIASIEGGIDRVLHESAEGDRLIGSLSLGYASSGVDVSSAFGNGSIDTDGLSVGAALTWYDIEGLYVDAQARALWTRSDLESTPFGTLAEDVKGFGYGLSVEVGKKIALSETWNVTPQVQLSYSNIESDEFTGPFATISDLGSESLAVRTGVVASNEVSWVAEDGTTSRRTLNMGVHVTKELRPETEVVVSGTTLTSETDDLSGEITVGGTYNWSDDKYSVYGEVGAGTGLNNFGDSTRVRGTVGMRVQWE